MNPETCEHEWTNCDDSFDHEFGTERILYKLCEYCGATDEVEPYQEED